MTQEKELSTAGQADGWRCRHDALWDCEECREFNWAQHDFWCQVAIAALLAWAQCYAFPWTPTFSDAAAGCAPILLYDRDTEPWR